MLKEYPQLEAAEVDRQGEAWLFCDVSTCDAAVQVTDATEITSRSGRSTVTTITAPMPEGWVTSDPEDNAMAGAADFCPKHSSRVPSIEPQSVISDTAP